MVSSPNLSPVAYEPDKRVMLKIKHERDCDCVVAGFRWYKESQGSAVGSLLLGLYDGQGMLQHVGVCASFTKEKRHELVEFLEPWRKNALAQHPWSGWAGSDSDNPDSDAASHARRSKPLEPGKRFVMGAVAPRARRRSRL